MAKDSLDNSPKKDASPISPDMQPINTDTIPPPIDYSESRSSDIPSPKEFGLITEELQIPAQNLSNRETQERTGERKEGFFKRMFSRKEKTDYSKVPLGIPIIDDFNKIPKSEGNISRIPLPNLLLNEHGSKESLKGISSHVSKKGKSAKLDFNDISTIPELPVIPSVQKIRNEHLEREQLIKKIKEMNEVEENIRKMHTEAKNRVETLNKLKESLSQKEKDLTKVKNDLYDKAKQVEVIRKQLSKKMKEPETIVSEVKKLKQSIDEKEKSFDETLKEIEKERETLNRIKEANLKKIEEEKSKLKEFRDTYLKDRILAEQIRLKELRDTYLKDKIAKSIETGNALKAKTGILMQKIKSLRSIEQKIEENKQALSKDAKAIIESKMIIKEKESFLRSYNSKKRLMDLKHEDLSQKEAMLNAKEENLKKLEAKLSNKENELKETKTSLDKAMFNYSKEKEEVEEDEFKEYLHKKLSEITSKREIQGQPQYSSFERQPDEPPRRQDKEQKIRSIIEECKRHISIRNFEQAKKIYNQIRLEYHDVILPQQKKEELYNEIRAIYDDINLGMLSR